MKKPRLNSDRMEVAVINLLDVRKYRAIVPNVSWGWGLRHEADLIAVTPNNNVTEIEIKISAGDLRADFKKGHNHKDEAIHRLVYAVPEKLKELALELVPPHCGIILVWWRQEDHGYTEKLRNGAYYARWERTCKYDRSKPPITDTRLIGLMRLGCMRIWKLKEKLNK